MAGFSATFVGDLLLSGRAGPRFLHESPVQLSIWTLFAANPNEPIDLLLTPYDNTTAAELARFLQQGFFDLVRGSRLTPIEGSVAVKVSFATFVSVILPATGFDIAARSLELFALIRMPPANSAVQQKEDLFSLPQLIAFVIETRSKLKPELRITLLIHLISAAASLQGEAWQSLDSRFSETSFYESWAVVPAIKEKQWSERSVSNPPLIWRVSENRSVSALSSSVQTIKADAAMRVFDVDCSSITWAVIDSGIDGSHPAFLDHRKGDYAIRVDKAYDFTRLRSWASYDSLSDDAQRKALVEEIRSKLGVAPAEARQLLDRLHDDMLNGRPYDWEVLSRLLEARPDRLESIDDGKVESHGTHVAGVLAGDWRENGQSVFAGVCPSLRLYDLRVLGSNEEDTEFAVIAALAFVRWLNSRNRYIVVHGVNLSIGLDHDKANFACGRTPVCLACDAVVSSGVVVVVAAGNYGSQSYETLYGYYSGYATVSISDPGNTESVITVGSTHRERPHEYGVSFFSSRGPTGDGRSKPDLVAPGERIDGPLPNLGFGKLDGTSMAAPHVSGAAAMLLARHPELVGDPGRVKSILKNSATDLGREQSFQGAGLVDVLRALQSI